MDKLFLLDAYALIYRSYYAFIKNPRINSKGLNTSAIMGFCNTLNEVLEKEKPTHIGVAFDPHGPTFRNEAYPAYKAQREETPEDIRASVPIIKDILRAYRIPILQVDGYEADDVIGSMAKQWATPHSPVYMVTPDKDYGQLIDDNFYNGRPFQYALWRLPKDCHQLELRILPLQKDMPVYFPREADTTPGEEIIKVTIINQ